MWLLHTDHVLPSARSAAPHGVRGRKQPKSIQGEWGDDFTGRRNDCTRRPRHHVATLARNAGRCQPETCFAPSVRTFRVVNVPVDSGDCVTPLRTAPAPLCELTSLSPSCFTGSHTKTRSLVPQPCQDGEEFAAVPVERQLSGGCAAAFAGADRALRDRIQRSDRLVRVFVTWVHRRDEELSICPHSPDPERNQRACAPFQDRAGIL